MLFDYIKIRLCNWMFSYKYCTSIQPFEDCCTIFVAKHPVTKPNLNIIKNDEKHLDDCIEEMLKTAIDTVERIEIK